MNNFLVILKVATMTPFFWAIIITIAWISIVEKSVKSKN
jgi:hypothetical protein